MHQQRDGQNHTGKAAKRCHPDATLASIRIARKPGPAGPEADRHEAPKLLVINDFQKLF
jgi:hypothetical protein